MSHATTKIITIDIPQDVLDRDYKGCGRAWAAYKDGRIVALRYMAQGNELPLTGWLKAVLDSAGGLDYHMLPVANSSKALSALAKAASACSDCPTPPRKDRYRPTELLSMARAAIAALDAENFTKHRQTCRAELAKLGDVISGMCSTHEFVIHN